MNTKQEAGNEKVTIYDIARQAGVSTTTVHKALHGQKGVSDAKRQEILLLAQNMNYARNTAAQNLARKELRIGVVAEVCNREFGSSIINGIKFALDQLKDSKLTGYFGHLENSLSRPRVLADFRDMLNSDMDAVILFPTGPYKEYEEFNAIIEGRNIPVITINNEIPHLSCLCSIQQDGVMLGRMAGDLMNLCNPGAASAVFIGSKEVHAQNASALSFEETIAKKGGNLSSIYETQVENQIGFVLTENMLHNYPEVSGIFVGVSQCIGVIDKLKSYEIVDKYKIITVDTYPEVLELLNAGIITATLDRRPYDMGQLAVHLLYQYFNSGIIPPKRILIPPSIITASAAETFNEALYPKISLLTGGIKILPPSDTEQ